jgi:hypothetical protein
MIRLESVYKRLASSGAKPCGQLGAALSEKALIRHGQHQIEPPSTDHKKRRLRGPRRRIVAIVCQKTPSVGRSLCVIIDGDRQKLP